MERERARERERGREEEGHTDTPRESQRERVWAVYLTSEAKAGEKTKRIPYSGGLYLLTMMSVYSWTTSSGS